MKQFGYARVSTVDQDLSIQQAALERAGVPAALIFGEKASGTDTAGRPQLARVLAICGAGDALVVTRIDRLARSLLDLQRIVHDLKARGIALRVIDQAVDTSTASGKAFLDMLGAFAEFETNLRRERQMEGIAKAKAEGRYKGRKPKISREVVREMRAAGLGPTAIARELGCDPSTVHRLR